MSLKTTWEHIKKWFLDFFKKLAPEVKKAIIIAEKIVNAIKDYDTSNPYILDFIKTLIKGDVDDKIIDTLREWLPKIVIELRLVDATVDLTDPDQILIAAVKVIQQLKGDYKSAFLNSLAQVIALVAADGKLSWTDVVYVMKWFYDNKDTPEVQASLK